MFKKKMREIIKPDLETFQKKKAIFITTDGMTHENSNYKWCKVSGLICSMEEYTMISVNSDGYIKDNAGIIYPLNNVLSIKWELLDEKVRISRYKDRYRMWFCDSDIEQMEEYIEK